MKNYTGKAYALLNVKGVREDPEEWTIEGIASTPTPDRDRDVVEPMGAKFKLPMPLLWQHNGEQPVGRVTFAKPTKSGIPYVAKLPKVKEAGALKDRIDEVVQSIKYGLVAAVSIGFRAAEDGVELLKNGGLHFKVWDWLELSVVTVPANPDATITGIKSIDDELRAASGRAQLAARLAATPPGVPGLKSAASGGSLTPQRKGHTVKTLNEQINDLRELRTTKSARMEELKTAAEADGMNDEQAAEFDALMLEVKQLDTDIRLKSFEAMNAAAARPVEGNNTKAGNGSRGPTIIVKNTDPDDKFKGQSFIRGVIAKAAAAAALREGNFVTPADIAAHRWGKSHPNLVRWIKAGVASGGTGSSDWGHELAQSDTRYTGDFVEFLYAMTVFDRLPLRNVPARMHIKGQDGAASASWVGEHKGIPVTSADASDVELTPLKVAAIAVASKELLADSSPSAEQWIRDCIAEASAQRVDSTFLSATAASAGVSPAGIFNGVTAFQASGADATAVRTDMQSMANVFVTNKNTGGLVHVMHPSVALAVSMMVNALGQTEFPGLTESGGTLFGRQVYTGDNVTSGVWALLKPSDIWKIGDSGISISVTDTATIEQDSAPAGAGDTPTAASATLMSLWQTEQIGFKVVRRINFAKRRSHAAQFVENIEYGGVIS